MKISAVELAPVAADDHSGQLLVLTSDSMLKGAGEIATDVDGQRSNVVLADLLVGKDPFDVEAFLLDVKQLSDGTIEDVALVSAATSAMLDLASQSIDAPLAQLLAGRMNDEAQSCAVDWVRGAISSAQLAAAAQETVAEGFTMLRVEPFVPDGEPELAGAVERVRVVRETVGDDVDLVVVGHPKLTPAAAEELVAALAPLEPLWIEDLVSPWPLGPLQRLSERLNQPLAAGRGTRPDVLRELARTNLADHLIIDVGRVGGLLEARRLAALAEIHHTGVIVTGARAAVSLRDSLQFASVLPNLSVVEVPRGLSPVTNGAVALTNR